MRHSRLLLLFLSVVASWSHAQVTVRRTLVDFGPQEQWRVHGVGPEVAALTTGTEGGDLTLGSSQKALFIPLIERRFGVNPLGSLERLELVADLQAGTGVQFNIRLRDRDGEVTQLAVQTLKPGVNTLSWTLPADLRFAGTWGAEGKRNGVLEPPLHLHELFLVRQESDQPAKVLLHELKAVDRCAPADAITAELEAGNEIHIIPLNNANAVPTLVLHSAADQALRLEASVRLTDFAGNRETLDQRVEVPANGAVRLPLPEPKGQGIFYVDYTLTDATGGKKEGRRSFAVMDPAGPTVGQAEGFLFSICTHTERWGERDQRLEVLAAGMCGAKVIRTGIGWGGIEPKEGELHFDRLDHLLQMYADQGMEIQYLLGFCPRWAAAPEKRDAADWHQWNNSMPREDAWRNWVRAMAQHYDGRIRYWEVWNEPDIGFWLGTLDEYLVLLRAAYEEIKAVDPKLQVMTGGFAIYNRNPTFIDGVIERGQQWFDIFAHHRHGDFRGFQAEVDGPIAKLRAQLNPPKPIYFNETAIASIGVGEKGQAETLVKKLSLAWARGAMGYTWYDLRNDGFDPHDYEHNYGMVTNDFYPKAVYPTYNTVVQILRGKEFVSQLGLGEDRWGFVFADAKETVIVAWNEARSELDEHYLLAVDGLREASQVDLMNNAHPLPVSSADRLSLPLSRTPQFVRLAGPHPELKVLGPELKLESITPAVPGKPVHAVLALHNLYTQPREYVAQWQLPKELGGGSGETAVTIPADTLGRLAVDLPIPASLRGRYGSSFHAKLDVGTRGQAPFAQLDVPVPLAAFVPAASTEPVFRLANRSQTVSLFEADPNKKQLLWGGPDDLSATAAFRRTDSDLLLTFDVRDDVHHQPKQGADVWQGDGIQLAFSVPGQDGYWEIGLTQLADGKPEVHLWQRAKGFADPISQIVLTTTTQPGGLRYEAQLPLAAFGLTPDLLRAGIALSFLVNDNDGEGRESWIELSDGIGRSKDPRRFPFVVFE